ncbi:hypothetical protein BO94DRAFT_138709 [Aspergillus sclerotioniger CBS 115572]|uniref:Uncharacterized protein n=1 Tax=Aspergillus sclerotioniger CBS 115572 TaxID=1450535 RepID=A0A317XCK9_9EURO|nr:hypothetical protein BO94DRAFT_138709 [Aspergillus sclerotioniger CBS 115572]PWY95861.1 hypothetical protein BO94DRAFT_138709 [Aspergillus sclerotioniger CBS 115572]
MRPKGGNEGGGVRRRGKKRREEEEGGRGGGGGRRSGDRMLLWWWWCGGAEGRNSNSSNSRCRGALVDSCRGTGRGIRSIATGCQVSQSIMLKPLGKRETKWPVAMTAQTLVLVAGNPTVAQAVERKKPREGKKMRECESPCCLFFLLLRSLPPGIKPFLSFRQAVTGRNAHQPHSVSPKWI